MDITTHMLDDTCSTTVADQKIKEDLGPRLLQQNDFFEQLFHGLPLSTAILKSHHERDRRQSEFSEAAQKSLIYGEVLFVPFAVLWERCTNFLRAGGTFVDIGSGVGKGVFAAAILHTFSRGECAHTCLTETTASSVHQSATAQHSV